MPTQDKAPDDSKKEPNWVMKGNIAWRPGFPKGRPGSILQESGLYNVPIPALVCPICGPLPKQENAPEFISGAGISLQGVTINQDCPTCGKAISASMPEYISFDYNGISSYLSSPEFTPQILSRLKGLATSVRTGGIPPEQFAAEANKIVPSLGNRLEQFCKDHSQTIAFLGVLSGILSMLIAGIVLFKPSEPTVITNNYYNTAHTENPILPKHTKAKPASRKGTNLTPLKKRKRRKK